MTKVDFLTHVTISRLPIPLLLPADRAQKVGQWCMRSVTDLAGTFYSISEDRFVKSQMTTAYKVLSAALSVILLPITLLVTGVGVILLATSKTHKGQSDLAKLFDKALLSRTPYSAEIQKLANSAHKIANMDAVYRMIETNPLFLEQIVNRFKPALAEQLNNPDTRMFLRVLEFKLTGDQTRGNPTAEWNDYLNRVGEAKKAAFLELFKFLDQSIASLDARAKALNLQCVRLLAS